MTSTFIATQPMPRVQDRIKKIKIKTRTVEEMEKPNGLHDHNENIQGVYSNLLIHILNIQ